MFPRSHSLNAVVLISEYVVNIAGVRKKV